MKTFKEYLNETVISPGFNPDHEKFREKHRQEIHDVLRNSYSHPDIGGYAGHKSGSKEESDAIHSDISNHAIKAVVRNGKVSAVNIYKKQHGRKLIASGTDGTHQGKKDYLMIQREGHTQKRDWAEVSGAPEHIAKKMGIPDVPNTEAGKLTGKKVELDSDGSHYTRDIGGSPHKKKIVGHPKFEQNQ